MHRISRFVFIAGGVLFPCLAELAATSVPLAATSNTRMALLLLERRLAVGGLAPEEFDRQASALVGVDVPSAQLAAAPVRVGMSELALALARRVDLHLVSDYPPEWLEPALAAAGLAGCFPPAQVYYLWRSGLTEGDYPAWFAALQTAGVIIPGSTLWVDHNSRRAEAALRQGVDVSIFVDARRFRRDLGLWGLAPEVKCSYDRR